MAQSLTPRQQEILDFIRTWTRDHRYPPTLREIGRSMNIRSTNGVSDHLRALERKGYLLREDMKSRALVPVEFDAPPADLAEREIRLDADVSPANDDMHLSIPQVGRVAAGRLHDAIEHIEQTYSMDASLFHGARPTFALKVQGDSMINAGINNGDILFVRKQTEARRGEIIVALVGDEATVKRYYPEADHIRLQPEHPTMRPIFVRKSEFQSFQIVGVAVGLFRSVAGMQAL